MAGLLRRAGRSYARSLETLNTKVGESKVGKFFKLEEPNTYFTQEIRAGTATFLTMAYILAVNASILTDSGGPCTVADCIPLCSNEAFADVNSCTAAGFQTILPTPACKFAPVNPGYQGCLTTVKKDLIVATAAAALIACFIMGMFANLPLALAPGMGTNAYFAYSVVGFHGSGSVTYQSALAAVLIEGVIFLLIAALGFRTKLAKLIPRPVRLSTSAGIGLLLAFIGLQSSNGLGLVAFEGSTLLTLGACPREFRVALAPVISVNGTTQLMPGGSVSSAIMCTKASYGRPHFLARNCGVSHHRVCNDKEHQGRYDLWHSVRHGRVVVPPYQGDVFSRNSSWQRIVQLLQARRGRAQDPKDGGGVELQAIQHKRRVGGAHNLFVRRHPRHHGHALLYGQVRGLRGRAGQLSGAVLGVHERRHGHLRRRAAGLVAGDDVRGVVDGHSRGGRTGVTAITVAFYFFLSLFFTPLLASIPPWAVGPALVLVGVMMVKSVVEIHWDDLREAVPAFVTIVLMPLTYSIAYGLIAGIATFLALHLGDWAFLAYERLRFRGKPRPHSHSAGISSRSAADPAKAPTNLRWTPCTDGQLFAPLRGPPVQ